VTDGADFQNEWTGAARSQPVERQTDFDLSKLIFKIADQLGEPLLGKRVIVIPRHPRRAFS
jgi:hypothetical protein